MDIQASFVKKQLKSIYMYDVSTVLVHFVVVYFADGKRITGIQFKVEE